MARPFYKAYGTMEEFIKAFLLRASETSELVKGRFYPATDGSAKVALGCYPAYELDANGELAYICGNVPNDCKGILEIVLVWISDTTHVAPSGLDIDISSDYADVNENYSTNSESDTTTEYDFAAGAIREQDISALFPDLAAGMYFGLKVELKENLGAGEDLYILGIRLKYK